MKISIIAFAIFGASGFAQMGLNAFAAPNNASQVENSIPEDLS